MYNVSIVKLIYYYPRRHVLVKPTKSIYNFIIIAMLEQNHTNYPETYEIKGAGSSEVNGAYQLEALISNRPYYKKRDSLISLWYFHSANFVLKPWCGWHLSKNVLFSYDFYNFHLN